MEHLITNIKQLALDVGTHLVIHDDITPKIVDRIPEMYELLEVDDNTVVTPHLVAHLLETKPLLVQMISHNVHSVLSSDQLEYIVCTIRVPDACFFTLNGRHEALVKILRSDLDGIVIDQIFYNRTYALKLLHRVMDRKKPGLFNPTGRSTAKLMVTTPFFY